MCLTNTQSAALAATLDVVDKVVKVLAVLIAGGWTYVNYIRGRTFKRRLEPSISGKVIRNMGVSFLSGSVQVKNVGLSKVRIEQKGTAVEVLAQVLGTDSELHPPKLNTKDIRVVEIFEKHGWVEPGEQIQESFFMVMPEGRDTIAILLKLRIVSEQVEWNADSLVEVSSA